MTKPAFSKDQQSTTKRLKTARERAGLNQTQAADLLGKTQSYISKIESGQKDLRVSQLRELARVYRKSVNYFLK